MMTKNSDDLEKQRSISKADRDARKAFRQDDAKAAKIEHEAAEQEFSQNRERLKADRLVREAAYPSPELPDD